MKTTNQRNVKSDQCGKKKGTPKKRINNHGPPPSTLKLFRTLNEAPMPPPRGPPPPTPTPPLPPPPPSPPAPHPIPPNSSPTPAASAPPTRPPTRAQVLRAEEVQEEVEPPLALAFLVARRSRVRAPARHHTLYRSPPRARPLCRVAERGRVGVTCPSTPPR